MLSNFRPKYIYYLVKGKKILNNTVVSTPDPTYSIEIYVNDTVKPAIFSVKADKGKL